MRSKATVVRVAAGVAALVGVVFVATASGAIVTSIVTSASSSALFSQNKQNEPAVAVDPANTSIVAAGANENIDMELCSAGDTTTCPFTPGVGSSGVYFSANGGASWTQPAYTGWSARACTGPAACAPAVGPIGTLPNYYQAGLVSDGDPSLAFGPQPDGHGGFSYANGARLYYGNLTSNFGSTRTDTTFKGFENIAVSHTDDLAGTGGNASWSAPVLVGKQNSALFNDKDTVWADDASSSRNFGNVYVCNTSFRGQEKGNGQPAPILFYRSTDGGSTFGAPVQLSAATNNPTSGGRQDCAVRTDSAGVVYAWWDGFAGNSTRVGAIYQTRSFDGGQSFEKPRVIATFTPCGNFDAVQGTLSFDGVAGNRTGSEPIADVANGAPTGGDATNEIVLTYCDGATPTDAAPGPNEQAVVIYSTDGGNTYTSAGNAAASSDRPDFPAVAISPDGSQLWLDYDAFLQPWQSTLTNPRLAQGVVRHAAVGTNGVPGAWADAYRGPTGDARGSSANDLTSGFMGDYNYIAATRTAGIAVWNELSNASDCPAIDAYRAALVAGTTATPPSPNTDCPSAFGNTDIASARIDNP
jgi:hypothetical protein